MQTISGKIIEQQDITKETYELIIETQESIQFLPGQFVMLSFKDAPTEKRAYSILRIQQEGKQIHFGIREEKNMSKQLRAATKETEVEIQGPMGRFILKEEENELILVAAGIGITPVLCILHELEKRNWKKRIHLFYSSSREENAAYLEEIKRIELKEFSLKLFLTKEEGEDSSGKIYGRRMNIEDIQKKIKNIENTEIYLCGPVQLVTDIKTAILATGIPRKQLHSEEFYSRS